LHQEVRIDRLPLHGSMPSWLSGTLVRNGPALFEAGDHPFNHWFDGLAMLHAFSFAGGRVSYANRFLRSSAYEAATREGKIRYSEFATDPCREIFKGAAAVYTPAPIMNSSVSIAQLGRRFVALTEEPMPVVFDPRTLKTLGVVPPDTTSQIISPHPHEDRRPGDWISYEVHFSASSSYLFTAWRDGVRRVLGAIPVREPGYLHAFGLSERHIVLAEYPLIVDPLRMLTAWKPYIENFRWEPQRGTRFLVLDRATGELRTTIETDAFFAFHHINAFERGDQLVVDIAAYQDARVIQVLYLDRLRSPNRSLRFIPGWFPRRYTLDLRTGTASMGPLADTALEFPRTNYERVNGRGYRFVYGAGRRALSTSDWLDQLVKVDVERGHVRIWREADSFPGEPVFVPSPHARAEDDGVALSVVLDGNTGKSFLLVLDAQTWTERARAMLPHHVPFGFHGKIISSG
jgi:carotenoid cleavage dioxygenase-like enzyme